jgi:hypothetical protein
MLEVNPRLLRSSLRVSDEESTPTLAVADGSRNLGDVHRAAAKAKEVLPRAGADAEKEGKKIGQEVGAKFDSAVSLAITISLSIHDCNL